MHQENTFESTIHIQQDGRDSDHPYLLVRCAVPHSNGRTYRVSFLCTPETHTNDVTGEDVTLWGIQLKGASFKDARSHWRFVSERHKKLRHELAFVPCQLVRAHLERNGYFN